MVGSPGQTVGTLYEDLHVYQKTAATYGWNRAVYPAKGYTVRTGTGWNNGTDPAAFEHHKADPSPCAFALDDGTWNDSSPWKREGDSRQVRMS